MGKRIISKQMKMVQAVRTRLSAGRDAASVVEAVITKSLLIEMYMLPSVTARTGITIRTAPNTFPGIAKGRAKSGLKTL